ncbi:MAG: hypothetical protein ABIA12_01670 [Candidatus Aenigmatarchaeota archaeon]
MQARCFCPEHGRLEFDDIRIKNGLPICAKCARPLEFGVVRPRPVAKPKPHSKDARRVGAKKTRG